MNKLEKLKEFVQNIQLPYLIDRECPFTDVKNPTFNPDVGE